MEKEKIKIKVKKRISKSKRWYFILLFASILLFWFLFPPLISHGVFSGHDTAIHLIYIRAVAKGLADGQFPVRWIDWPLAGFNQPTFDYYQSLFYYLVLIPRIFNISYTASLNLTVLSLWISSGIFMFIFARRYFGNLGGALSAVFYIFAPYHILDVFVRAALPEFLALTIIPAIFWAIKAFQDTGRGLYLTLLAIFTGSLVIAHSPMFIMFAPFIFLYILFLFWQTRSVRSLLYLFLALLVGFGTISFFIFPAVLEQKFIQSTFLHAGYYDFHNHFVCWYQLFIPSWGYGISTPDCNDGMSFQLGIAHWLAIFLLTGFLIYRYKQKKFDKSYSLFILFLVFIFISLYFTLYISLTIWDGVSLLALIQYPWRFLSVATFFASFLAGGVLLFFKKDRHKHLIYAGLVLLVIFSYAWYLHPAVYLPEKEINFETKEYAKAHNINQEAVNPEPGYMPIWTEVLPPPKTMSSLGVRVLSGGGINLFIVKDTFTYKEYLVGLQTDAKLGFYVHYFPGWKLYIDGVPGNIAYDNIFGYIEFNAPKGKHKIILSFENTPVRKIGNILSIIFFIGSFALLFVN